ncbi:MAG: TIM barrel protein [Acidobacteriota bacterium]
MTRRSFLPIAAALPALGQAPADRIARKGRLKQSVSRWCFNKIPMEDFCREVARLGLAGIDLLGPAEWPVVQKFGLVPTLGSAGGKSGPLNRKENHDAIEKQFREGIEKAAAAKVPNLIIMSGNRAGMSDAEGLDNCVLGLNRIKPIAEDKGVTIVLELLNSKVDHKDYMADRTSWAVEAIKRVNSPRIKVLYDIYHMQIMEGDVIRTIRQNIQHIGHFHTGGNPGRHEIDDTQELNYRAISQAIVDTGFTGYFAHEFVPARPEPLKSLAQAVDICDV